MIMNNITIIIVSGSTFDDSIKSEFELTDNHMNMQLMKNDFGMLLRLRTKNALILIDFDGVPNLIDALNQVIVQE